MFALKANWPRIRLSIEVQAISREDSDRHTLEDHRRSPLFSPYLRYPLKNLTSCTVDHCRPSDVLFLKKVLLESPELEDLSLTWSIRSPHFLNWNIRDGERLPPVRKLVLRGIDWHLSPLSAVTFWDWSRISHLELYVVPIVRFLRTVKPEHLPNLRTFMTDSWCSRSSPSTHERTQLLCNFAKGIQSLERLAMRCEAEDNKVPQYIEAVTEHASTLRSLHIRTPNLERHWRFVVKDLTALHSVCPELRELGFELEMKVTSQPSATLTTTIAGFRKLRSLTVYASMLIENRKQAFNEDRAVAFAWIKDLVSSKQGVQLEKVVIKLEARKGGDMYYTTLSYTRNFGGAEEWHRSECYKEGGRKKSRFACLPLLEMAEFKEMVPFPPAERPSSGY